MLGVDHIHHEHKREFIVGGRRYWLERLCVEYAYYGVLAGAADEINRDKRCFRPSPCRLLAPILCSH